MQEITYFHILCTYKVKIKIIEKIKYDNNCHSQLLRMIWYSCQEITTDQVKELS